LKDKERQLISHNSLNEARVANLFLVTVFALKVGNPFNHFINCLNLDLPDGRICKIINVKEWQLISHNSLNEVRVANLLVNQVDNPFWNPKVNSRFNRQY
jgi:hypothetical protein